MSLLYYLQFPAVQGADCCPFLHFPPVGRPLQVNNVPLPVVVDGLWCLLCSFACYVSGLYVVPFGCGWLNIQVPTHTFPALTPLE